MDIDAILCSDDEMVDVAATGKTNEPAPSKLEPPVPTAKGVAEGRIYSLHCGFFPPQYFHHARPIVSDIEQMTREERQYRDWKFRVISWMLSIAEEAARLEVERRMLAPRCQTQPQNNQQINQDLPEMLPVNIKIECGGYTYTHDETVDGDCLPKPSLYFRSRSHSV